MGLKEHLETAGSALRRWLIAQTFDSLTVGAIWLIGLLVIHVPGAVFWALLGALVQFIPNVGPVLALVGPAVAAAISGGLERLAYVFILYTLIALIDGFLLQPYFMRRTAGIPIWASIFVPILLGTFFSFWGVVVSAPLLAVIYAYRGKATHKAP